MEKWPIEGLNGIKKRVEPPRMRPFCGGAINVFMFTSRLYHPATATL